MPGSPTPPNLNPAPPSSAGAAQSIEAPPCDWTSTMTTATGPASAPVNAPTSSNKRRRDAMQQDIAGRDYYNNLKQSELVDLVVKLQEQNLILTRLLERSTLTAAATSSAPASSNARLNLTPNVNFTRTKSGSAASRYASETDFPTLNNNAGTKKGSAAATANTDNNATTTKKSSGSNKKASKKSSSKTKVPTDAAEAKKWALRLFTTPTAAADANDGDDTQMSSTSTTASSSLPPPGYTCVYLPCGHKTKHAELRTRLQILKINLKRVYAIQRPAKHVVSLLVHSHYAPEILKICEEDGLNPITDFDPISGKNLGDPNLTKNLNAQQLDDKAKAIYYNRMLQAAAQLSESRVGLSILKFFNALDSSDHHYVPSVIIDEFIKLKPDCVRKISAANTARSVLKGFDASALFASLAATSSSVNAESSISNNGSTPTLSTAANSQPTFKLATLNVSGISTSLDLVVQYIETHNIDILLLTETFLLKGDLFTQWAQHHQYATISGDASKGNGGLTFLIRPHFPHYVHRSTDSTSTQHNKLSIVIGNSLTVHGFYLPPALSFADYQAVLGCVDFSSTSSVICLGDFNTRLGSFTGDTRSTSPRSTYLLNWLTVHQANMWNRVSAFGQPTFESNRGTSIIDFVVSRPNIFSANPLLSIENDINLNSDHHLVLFSFRLQQQPQLLSTSTMAGNRRLWNLQRLEEKEVFALYRKKFFSNIFRLQQEVKHFMAFQQQQHPNLFVLSGNTAAQHRKEATINQRINATNGFSFEVVESPKDFINRVGIEMIQAIHSALDISVAPRVPRPKTWKFFWDADLQHLADIRQQCYTDWKQHKHHRRSLIGSTHLWSLYQQACNNLKKTIKAAKRRHWKKFCNDMSDSSPNQVYSVLKRLRKKHTTNHCFSHSEGPEVAANVMADYQRQIFGGDQLDFSAWRASRSPLHQHTTKPTFFSASAIKQQLSAMGNRKAPGDDHIVKEMLMPIWYPLCQFLSEFFTLCYTFAWTPASFRSGLIVPIFKKGDPNSAANYRPISFTNTFRKLYERCLKFCLLLHMPSLDVAQGGFRAARSGISQAWNLLALQQQFEQQYGVSPALIFMDISKAYDSVTRSRIWQLLHPHLPKPLFYTLRHLFDHVTLNVVINNATSLLIHPKRGLLQGSILSPFLYAIFINQLPALLRTAPVRFPLYVDVATRARTDGDGPSAVIAEPSLALVKYGEGPRLSEAASSCSPRLGAVRQRTAIHCLLYADDVCLIAHRRDMPLLVQLCEEYSLRFDFKWSPTKCALVNYRPRRRPIQLYGINVPLVSSYEYPGVPFNASGVDNIAFLNASTKKAKSTMALFRRLGVHQYGFGLLLALQVYRVFVRPIMEYALALLGLNATSAMAIDRTQADCLKMTLNQSTRHNSPSMVLNMMGNLPAMYTRAQILTFKFWHSLQLKARPYTLVECLLYTHQRLKLAPALWRRLSSNKIWKMYKASPTPTTPRLICEEFQDAQLLKWTTQKSSCLRALHDDTSGYDPLLFYPCTRLERLRLIRWRFHHLPSFPLSACRCGAPSANRFHYLATCPLVQDIINRIHLNLPDDSIPLDESYDDQGIATTHILDRILNSLPSTLSFCLSSHWERTWPLVLELVTQIDFASHPAVSFAEEPPAGELYEHYLTQQRRLQQRRL